MADFSNLEPSGFRDELDKLATIEHVGIVASESRAVSDLQRLLAWDDFRRTSIGDAPSGQTWANDGGSFSIEDEKRLLAGGGNAFRYLTVDVGALSAYARVSVKPDGSLGNNGLTLAYVDSANHLNIGYRAASNNGLRVRKRIGDSETTEASNTDMPLGGDLNRWVVIEAWVWDTGSELLVYAVTDGIATVEATISGSDYTALAGATRVGVAGYDGGTRWSGFSVRGLA